MKLTVLLLVMSTMAMTNALDLDQFLKDQLDRCIEECDKKACSGDVNTRTGCNQMYSCAHACKIRNLGVQENSCRELCQRNGQSGCSPTVKGWQFNLCAPCQRAGCSTYPSVGECESGCNLYR